MSTTTATVTSTTVWIATVTATHRSPVATATTGMARSTPLPPSARTTAWNENCSPARTWSPTTRMAMATATATGELRRKPPSPAHRPRTSGTARTATTGMTPCTRARLKSLTTGWIQNCSGVDLATYFADGDGDSYGDAESSRTSETGTPAGHVIDSTDCDDGDTSVHPGAVEADNGVDDDCDGTVDDGLDGDRDGFTPAFGGDCNDGDPWVNPGAPEADNGIDDDCDGAVDEGLDGDGDGYTPVADGDCNDDDPAVRPGTSRGGRRRGGSELLGGGPGHLLRGRRCRRLRRLGLVESFGVRRTGVARRRQHGL